MNVKVNVRAKVVARVILAFVDIDCRHVIDTVNVRFVIVVLIVVMIVDESGL